MFTFEEARYLVFALQGVLTEPWGIYANLIGHKPFSQVELPSSLLYKTNPKTVSEVTLATILEGVNRFWNLAPFPTVELEAKLREAGLTA